MELVVTKYTSGVPCVAELSTERLFVKYLNEFEYPWWMVDHSGCIDLSCDGRFKVWIASLLQDNAREQIVDQTEEQRLIFVNLGGRKIWVRVKYPRQQKSLSLLSVNIEVLEEGLVPKGSHCKQQGCTPTHTSLDRFMSRRTRMTVVLSLSFGYFLFTVPRVRSTDRMLRRPKS